MLYFIYTGKLSFIVTLQFLQWLNFNQSQCCFFSHRHALEQYSFSIVWNFQRMTEEIGVKLTLQQCHSICLRISKGWFGKHSWKSENYNAKVTQRYGVCGDSGIHIKNGTIKPSFKFLWKCYPTLNCRSNLSDIVDTIPKSKRNRRCILHSLETHKARASG